MIPTENIEVKPDGQLVLQRNTKDLVVQGDAVFTGDIDAQNGVLQIDQIELPAGAAQSVKKIYFHPITLVGTGTQYTDANDRLFFIILDNSSTAYTMTTFRNFLMGLSGARFLCNGFIVRASKVYIPAYLLATNETITIVTYNITDGSQYNYVCTSEISEYTLYDGVNPIN